jgi:5'-3' exonuclease
MLPKVYGDLAFGELASYFPSEFEIDLNGKTLSWEAICLIPFVDEHVFLEAEKR